MPDTSNLSPGDRRELRSLVKKQFAVLRADVKRREAELKGEIESEIARQYREQDEAINQAKREMRRAREEYAQQCQRIADELQAARPELSVEVTDGYRGVSLDAGDPSRAQKHRALVAAIPQQISSANSKLDQEELDLLRDLTVGALTTDQGRAFLDRIPTVGVLVPKARLVELEGEALR